MSFRIVEIPFGPKLHWELSVHFSFSYPCIFHIICFSMTPRHFPTDGFFSSKQHFPKFSITIKQFPRFPTQKKIHKKEEVFAFFPFIELAYWMTPDVFGKKRRNRLHCQKKVQTLREKVSLIILTFSDSSYKPAQFVLPSFLPPNPQPSITLSFFLLLLWAAFQLTTSEE